MLYPVSLMGLCNAWQILYWQVFFSILQVRTGLSNFWAAGGNMPLEWVSGLPTTMWATQMSTSPLHLDFSIKFVLVPHELGHFESWSVRALGKKKMHVRICHSKKQHEWENVIWELPRTCTVHIRQHLLLWTSKSCTPEAECQSYDLLSCNCLTLPLSINAKDHQLFQQQEKISYLRKKEKKSRQKRQ